MRGRQPKDGVAQEHSFDTVKNHRPDKLRNCSDHGMNGGKDNSYVNSNAQSLKRLESEEK